MSKTTYRDISANTPPRWFWIVSVVALLWMLVAVATWVVDLLTDETALTQLSEAQRQVYQARPQWLFVLYGIAVGSGFLGTVALLLRSRRAVMLFFVSLVTAVVQFGYTFFVMNAIELLGPALALPFPLIILAIGVGLLYLALFAKRMQWLR